ncbi:sensor domain-containing protein [Streptomyces sp. B6B3]|uniref:sensor domain-containing protein n=1 Tax=Streptomyces sp. B6B3 TaxID=3153570 RepID=UPI00325CE8F3
MTAMTAPNAATTASAAGGLDHAGRPRGASRFWRELGYLLAGLPVGIAAFTVVVTGLSVGVSAVVLVVGLPLLAGTLAAARGFAGWERRRLAAVTGQPPRAPRYVEREGHGLARTRQALRDGQAWRDVLHAVASFPIRVLTFSLALTWTLGGLGELLYATWSWPIPRDDNAGLLDLMFGIDSRLADIAFNMGIGVVLLATAVPMVRGLAALQAGVAHGLLTPAE